MVAVPCQEVPPAAGVNEAMRLNTSFACCAVTAQVVEAQLLVVAAGSGNHRECPSLNGWPAAGRRHGGSPQSIHTVSQPCRKSLFKLGHCLKGRLFESCHRARSRGSQSYCHSDGFVVVKEQWWQRRTGRETIPSGDSSTGVHPIAEYAQPFNIVADRPGRHLQPAGEVSAGPVASHLQEGEQAEQTN